MLVNLLVGVIAFLLGYSLSKFLKTLKKSEENEDSNDSKYLRRGIVIREYTATSNFEKEDIECQFEVGEIERTDTKSKIVVINAVPNKSKYCTEDWISKFKNLVDNIWIDSNEIEWIYENKKEKRNKKIDELLK